MVRTEKMVTIAHITWLYDIFKWPATYLYGLDLSDNDIQKSYSLLLLFRRSVVEIAIHSSYAMDSAIELHSSMILQEWDEFIHKIEPEAEKSVVDGRSLSLATIVAVAR